ncbi:3-keto-5-aminohexanoate cleavage protein [Lutibaculum baratangense]|uniref:3-keto-5-aminohexanoate cleavage enzyme n=1 Tax=Lutibaculum baratangense AMV1 TaxID=631454 RepID=V4RHI1_9HYPH|nr:3-keto-5-aminohexanoate cleavage protein [Lutibaculum baratangense]ESR24809.1 hypothetical protein N177_2132 [Lutibaculum baratangense AMV1]
MNRYPTYIMAAPNGARRTKRDHPNLPITIPELVEEAVRCLEAGACALHVHVRDADGGHILDAGLYREALAAIRAEVGSDLVLQATTEAVGRYGAAEQIALVRELKPEAVSVALREIYPEGSDPAPVSDIFNFMSDEAIWPQLILYDADDVRRFATLRHGDLFRQRRSSVLLVLGRYATNQMADPAELEVMLDALEPARDGVEWCVCAFGPAENEVARAVFAKGGHMRVGFENNLETASGERAEHTADLVRAAVAEAKAAGRSPMTATHLRRAIALWR